MRCTPSGDVNISDAGVGGGGRGGEEEERGRAGREGDVAPKR